MPSSIAVATRDTIRPTYFSSASLNCGMALVALDVERPGEAAVADFFRRFRERYPFPPTYRRDLTARGGGPLRGRGWPAFAVERFRVDPSAARRGRAGRTHRRRRYGGARAGCAASCRGRCKQLSRIRFGTIGPSNHFVELQEVDGVLDPQAASAARACPRPGDAAVPRWRRLAARRARSAVRRVASGTRPAGAGADGAQKPLYHFGRARSIRDLRRRRKLYFSASRASDRRDDSPRASAGAGKCDGDELRLRVPAVGYASLTDAAREAASALGANGSSSTPPHNSIYDEQIGGEPAIVHRHNACRIFPLTRMRGHPVFGRIGQPLLLPGTNRTSSYVCIPGEPARRAR